MVRIFSDFLDLKPSDFINSIMKEIICEVCNYNPRSNHDLQKHCLTDSHLYKLGKKKCAICHSISDIKDLGEWGTIHVNQCKVCIQYEKQGKCKCIYCGLVVPRTKFDTIGQRCQNCKLLNTGEGKAIKCDCGGSYKDIRSARERHFMSKRHMKLFGDELHKETKRGKPVRGGASAQ